MIIIGLTGSIGMGKTTISTMMKLQGIPVHEADKAVHKILKTNQEVKDQIRRQFPTVVEKGEINRKKLAHLVFNDPENLEILESIIHPVVKNQTMGFLKKHRQLRTKMVCLDIPLLFEKDIDEDPDYHFTTFICVKTKPFLQRERVLRRPGMTESLFEDIKSQQIPDQLKEKFSHFVIETGLSKRDSLKQLKKIIAYLRTIHRPR